MRAASLLVVLALVAFVCHVSGEGDTRADGHKGDADPRLARHARAATDRSFFRACHRELRTLCPNNREVSCLEEHIASVSDPKCLSWLNARTACLGDVGASDCAQSPLLECLPTIPEEKLSAGCAKSEFYTGTMREVKRMQHLRKHPRHEKPPRP